MRSTTIRHGRLSKVRMIHVLPLGDVRDHARSADCWCGPSVDRHHNATIHVHVAADGRVWAEAPAGGGPPGAAWACEVIHVPRGPEVPG